MNLFVHGMECYFYAGDVNIDMLKQNYLDVKRYTETKTLDSLNLEQVITKATRTTKSSRHR